MPGEARVGNYAAQRALQLTDVRADSLANEKGDLFGENDAGVLRLRNQDCYTGFEVRWLDRHGQTTAKARFQSLLEALDLLWIAIASQDHLPLALKQSVEGMEKLFLRSILASEELNVVDHERVQRPICRLELVHGVVLQGAHHIAHETLRMDVGNSRSWIVLLYVVSNGVHQMRFS